MAEKIKNSGIPRYHDRSVYEPHKLTSGVIYKSKPENPETGGACTIVSSLFKMTSRHSLISWLLPVII